MDTLYSLPFVTIGVLVWIAHRLEAEPVHHFARLPSHGLTRDEAPKLYNMLENLCISRDDDAEARHRGSRRAQRLRRPASTRSSYITFTRGLLNILTTPKSKPSWRM